MYSVNVFTSTCIPSTLFRSFLSKVLLVTVFLHSKCVIFGSSGRYGAKAIQMIYQLILSACLLTSSEYLHPKKQLSEW